MAKKRNRGVLGKPPRFSDVGTIEEHKVILTSPGGGAQIYNELWTAVKKLKVGQSILVDTDGATVKAYRNRLQASFRRLKMVAPVGGRYVIRSTEDGKVAVAVENLKAKATKKAKAAK